MSLDVRISALAEPLNALHASAWLGSVEEVGTGGWCQCLLQSVAGASGTLFEAHNSYARQAQQQRYAESAGRSVSATNVEHWAKANLRPDISGQFFSLVFSGAVASHLQSGDAHAWVALALADGRGWTLHLRCLETQRLAQQVSLGEFGVSLLSQLAQQDDLQPADFKVAVASKFEIDFWRSWQATDFENSLRAIELLQAGLSPLVLLKPAASRLLPVRYLDELRGRRLLLHKGSFNPVTLAHLEMLKRVLEREADYLPVLEISLQNADKGLAEAQNLAHRLAMLAYQPWPVALTHTPALYLTRELFQQRAQASQVDFICGEDLYRRVFQPRYYQQLKGGIAEGLERLFATGSQLWVCGRENDLPFEPEAQSWALKYQTQIHPLEMDLPMASSAVREMLQTGQTGWRQQLLPEVAHYLEIHQLYTLGER